MRYIIKNKLYHEEQNIPDSEECPIIDVITEEEYHKEYEKERYQPLSFRGRIRHCKVEIFESYIRGTLAIPNKKYAENKKQCCRFYFDKERLVFVGETEWVINCLERIEDRQIADLITPAQVLFELLGVLVSEEGEYLDDYEDSLCEQENHMLLKANQIPSNFDHYILRTRKELLILNHYYKQLAELGQLLSDCPNDIIEPKAKSYFRFFAKRLERLLTDAQNLREYCLQIRDMYQTRLDVRQNKIMQLLTIVTTIFMPLTLLTGWYGMNFRHMPELAWKYGYGIVVLLALFLIITEWLIFKKKKWL